MRDRRRNRARLNAIDRRPLIVACLFAALALTALFTAQAAFGATTPISTETLARNAHRVVLADVRSVTPRLDAAQGIVTDVELDIVRGLRGTSGSSVRVVVPGGTVGGLTLVVSETPSFTAGERVVVFLDAENRVFGGMRGALKVEHGAIASSGETLARFEQRVSDSPVSPSVLRAEENPVASAAAAASTDDAQATPASTPVITAVSPASAPAGVGATIKIYGSGFGVRGTASKVQFRYEDPARITGAVPFIDATGSHIKSWSDGMIEVEVPVGDVGGYPGSAGSGPLRVVTSTGATSNTYTFTVTFSYGGYRWADSDLNQGYYVWANTADTTSELQLLQAAAATWSAASPFKLTYSGAISSAPYALTSPTYNSRNDIWWANMGSGGVLAQARYWFMNGNLWEADMVFNDSYNWGTGTTGTFDVQSVALHEFGHWLTLRDLYGEGDYGEVMYGVLGQGTQRRTLSADDAAGVGWIYGGIDVTPPETTIYGVPAGWTTGQVTISLAATDDGGTPTTYYRIGTEANQLYSGPFVVPGEGAIAVRYWSVDAAGNTEAARTATVNIDRSAPVTTISGADSGYGSVSLSLVASDAGSGVAAIYYRVNGGTTRTGTAVTLGGTGTHTVQAWSVDALGNTESPAKTKTVTIYESPDIDVARLAGTDRYSTAITISQNTFAAGSVDTLVVATGAQFADALSASGLAGAYGSPLLLTPRDALPASVRAEATRLGAKTVVLVGGTSAISTGVESTLRSAGFTVERIAGADRYATAAAVARKVKALTGSTPDVFIARGDAFADALAAAPYAYSRTMPILLVSPTSLPAATASALRDIGATGALLTGGTGAISSAVEAQVKAIGVTTSRAQGVNRYETSAALVRHAIDAGWVTPEVIGVTTGQDFPDALGGGVAIGARNGAVVLTEPTRLTASAAAVLADCTNDLSAVSILGGEGAVSPAVVQSIKDLWGMP